MSKRRHLSAEQKVAIVRRHLLEHVPISDLCDEFGIHATQYYAWQKQLFENGSIAFERKTNQANQRRQRDAQQRNITALKEKLQKKDEVVAETKPAESTVLRPARRSAPPHCSVGPEAAIIPSGAGIWCLFETAVPVTST